MPAAAAPGTVRAPHVPDSVKSFVSDLYRYIRDGDVGGTHTLYEATFQALSASLYRDATWPPAEAVAAHCDGDEVFLLLYRELTSRHAHARVRGLTLEDRADSWDNYCGLFGVVLRDVVTVKLPNRWLWDMVDGFVCQFQRFCLCRAKQLKDKSTEEETNLPTRLDQAWDVYGVLNYLKALVEKSMIREILEEKEGLEEFTMMIGYDRAGGSNVLKMLGYYSMIGLLRVHCLLGDYWTGLKCLSPIDISQQGVYTTEIGSYISTIYHYGFANFMLRRYVDAIHQFNKILLYMLKYRQCHPKFPQYDLLLKKTEQMYALLAICLSLCPRDNVIDENVSIELKEKYDTEMTKMLGSGGEACYDELFSFACPKFIATSPSVHYNQDASHLQLKLFRDEVKQHQFYRDVISFLKLFSVVTIRKLALRMGLNETTLRTILLAYAQKTHAVDNYGSTISTADIDFYIDEDTIHATDSKPIKHRGDYFLTQILKFEQVIGELGELQLD